MKITYSKPITVDIKPGDDIELRIDCHNPRIFLEFTKVKRITERDGLLWVVFTNNTWRPFRTYGTTWWKTGDVEC